MFIHDASYVKREQRLIDLVQTRSGCMGNIPLILGYRATANIEPIYLSLYKTKKSQRSLKTIVIDLVCLWHDTNVYFLFQYFFAALAVVFLLLVSNCFWIFNLVRLTKNVKDSIYSVFDTCASERVRCLKYLPNYSSLYITTVSSNTMDREPDFGFCNLHEQNRTACSIEQL